MRHYETMFIVKPTLTPEETQARIEFVKETLTKNGAEIVTTEDWGTRHLAYEIEKHKRGHYYVIYFKTEPSSIPELERIYNITEDIIRFIVIKYESKKEVTAWQDMVNKANKPKDVPAPRESREAAPAPKKEEAAAPAPKEEAAPAPQAESTSESAAE